MNASDPSKKRRIGAEAVLGTFGANLAIQACTVLQGVLLARLLGPIGRGEFAAVVLWPNLFAAIGLFGLDTALARRAGAESDYDALTRAGLVLGVGVALCTSALCYLLLPLLLRGHPAELAGMSRCYIPFIFFNHLTLVFVSIDQGSGNFKGFNWTRLTLNPVYLAVIATLWALKVTAVFPCVLGLMGANGIVLMVRFARYLREGSLFGHMAHLRPITKEAIRFGLADFISPLYQQIDKALLLFLLGVRDLGFYTVALAASSVAGSLASALSSVAFGISAQARGPEAFARIARVFRCSAWAWLVLGTGLALAMPLLVPLIFGKEFAPAAWPAIMLIPGGVFAGQGSILEQTLRGQGRAFVGLEARILGLMVMAPVAWLASRFWGIIGVPIAYDLAQFLCLMVFCIRTNAHFEQSNFSALLPTSDDFAAIWSSLAHQFRRRLKPC